MVDTNLGGTFFLVQAVLPYMRAAGAGRIVVITSEWGVTGWPEATAYAAAKSGLISLVKTLGRELAPEHIIVNAVAPGVTDTPQLQVDADAAGVDLADDPRSYATAIPLGRIGVADEVAAAVELLSDFDAGSGCRSGDLVQRRLDTDESMNEGARQCTTDPYRPRRPGVLGQVDAQAGAALRGLGTFARLPQRHEVGDYDIAVVGRARSTAG